MLINQLSETLANSLLRKSASKVSRYAEQYLRLGKPIPGPLRITPNFPWSREMMDCKEDWVGKKAAQMAYTINCIAKAIKTIDIDHIDVMYILPKQKPDAMDFSASKLGPIIKASPHLASLFSGVDNAGHKQAGTANFYLRGSRSRSALKSISVGLQIYDEYDEMSQVNLSLAEERSSGYEERDIQTIKISTPTFPDFGISKEFENTDQSHYFFKCPFCSLEGRPRLTEFLDLDNLRIPTDNRNDTDALKQSVLLTSCCKTPLPSNKASYISETNAKWYPTVSNPQTRGFWIPQFYSMVRPLWRIARKIIDGRSDPIINTEVYNSILGKEYVPEGARILPEMVDACRGTHHNKSQPQSQIVTMGVDVGHKELYVNIDEWLLPPELGPNLNSLARCRTRALFTVSNFYELDAVMRQYQVKHAVIDVDPVLRDALDFCNRFPGRANLCRFVRTIKAKEVLKEEGNNEIVLQVNRTNWLDLSQSRFKFKQNAIILPQELPPQYGQMISRIIKKQEYDRDKNIVSKYVSLGADHWAFSRVYSEIALPLAIAVNESRNIESFL